MGASAEEAGTIYLITGVPASGKSTIAEACAQRTPRSVHLRGDVFRRFVVSGREEMSGEPSDEAVLQLRLRYELAAWAAARYAASGFTVFYQDVILGKYLQEVVDLLQAQTLRVIVLNPSAETVGRREAARDKTAYGEHVTIDLLVDGLQNETEPIGQWLDTSDMTIDDVVDAILETATE